MTRFATLLLVLPAALAAGPAWFPFVQSSVAWHDNATNANRAGDILGALQVQAEFSAMRRTPLGRDDTWFTTVAATVESWPRFDGLDRAGAGARLAWQHKFGLGPFAPLLNVEAIGDLLAAREADRAGRQGALALQVRQRLTNAWRARARHEHLRADTRGAAFARTARESTLAFDFEVAAGWRLSAAGAYRQGTVPAYARPPRPDLLREGRARGLVTTFDRAAPLMSYTLEARTRSGRVEAAHSLDPRRTVSLAAEYRDTRRGPVGYTNRILTAGMSQRF